MGPLAGLKVVSAAGGFLVAATDRWAEVTRALTPISNAAALRSKRGFIYFSRILF